MKRSVPAVAPERGAGGLLPCRAHAYREALASSTSSAATMVVHSSRDTMISFPSAVGSACTLAWFAPCSGSCARVRITTARFDKGSLRGIVAESEQGESEQGREQVDLGISRLQ